MDRRFLFIGKRYSRSYNYYWPLFLQPDLRKYLPLAVLLSTNQENKILLSAIFIGFPVTFFFHKKYVPGGTFL